MVDAALQLLAAAAAADGEILPRRIAPENGVGDSVGIGRNPFIGVDEKADTGSLAVNAEGADIGDVIEPRDGRSRASRSAVDEDVAAAVLVVDLVRGDARRPVVAEEAAAPVTGAIAAINVPAHGGRRRLVALRKGTHVQPGAPLGDAVVGEFVAGDGERVAEQVERAAVRGAGLGPRIAVDAVVLDGDLVLVLGVVEEQRAAAAA